MKISMTSFVAGRHFNNPEFSGTKIEGSPEAFTAALNKVAAQLSPSNDLVDGYAPFCKHLFVENFTDCKTGIVRITDDNRHLLRSEYSARREGELAVLSRYLDASDMAIPRAAVLDVILYTAEKMKAEGEEIDGDWGIVSINAGMEAVEAPMPPITMMRNALGKEEGGSGVPLDREKYIESVRYWSEWATVR